MEKRKSVPAAMGIIDALSPYECYTSGSRVAMLVSMVSQTPPPSETDVPHTLNGQELEMAKYTTSIKMPGSGIIEAVIPKYQAGGGYKAIHYNSKKTIIFFNEDEGNLDAVEVSAFSKMHDIFAHPLKETQESRFLREGNGVGKDTVLAKSTTTTDDGIFSQSLTVNFAFLSHPSSIEDGFWVNRRILDRAAPTATAKLTAEWGSSSYPLNLYGDRDYYRPFPDNGEHIREDGLVFAIRKADEIFDVVNMLPEMLERPDRTGYDKLVYAPPEALDASVYDIDVINTTEDKRANPQTPIGMEEQAAIYKLQMSNYHKRVLDVVEDFQRKNPTVPISDLLHTIVREAYSDKPLDPRSRKWRNQKISGIRRVVRGVELDEWHVTVHIRYKFFLGLGSKSAGMHGNKGVTCKIAEPEEMPYNDQGDVVDIIGYGPGCIARLNPGQLYEQYAGAAKRDAVKQMKQFLESGAEAAAWNYYLDFLSVCAPEDYQDYIDNPPNAMEMKEILKMETERGYLVTSFNENIGPDWVEEMEQRFPPYRGKLNYINMKGEWDRTMSDVLVGPVSFMFLDKSAFKPMSVAIPQLNNFRLPSTQNKSTKVSSPVNKQAPRANAEDEFRAGMAFMPATQLLDHIEFSTSPEVTDHVMNKLIQSDTPTAERKLIDRNEIPYGSGANVKFVKHIFSIRNIEIVNTEAK